MPKAGFHELSLKIATVEARNFFSQTLSISKPVCACNWFHSYLSERILLMSRRGFDQQEKKTPFEVLYGKSVSSGSSIKTNT
jgi:hypothetical protein